MYRRRLLETNFESSRCIKHASTLGTSFIRVWLGHFIQRKPPNQRTDTLSRPETDSAGFTDTKGDIFVASVELSNNVIDETYPSIYTTCRLCDQGDREYGTMVPDIFVFVQQGGPEYEKRQLW